MRKLLLTAVALAASSRTVASAEGYLSCLFANADQFDVFYKEIVKDLNTKDGVPMQQTCFDDADNAYCSN